MNADLPNPVGMNADLRTERQPTQVGFQSDMSVGMNADLRTA